MIRTLCTRTAPSVSERGRVTVPCKDWPSATASGGYGLDKGLPPALVCHQEIDGGDCSGGTNGLSIECAGDNYAAMR
jgi:hypothetical protein